jgi:hypothetical protein
MEGFYVQGSRAQRCNNPGDLDLEPWLEAPPYCAVLETIPHGYHERPRFACFPTVDQGWSAMRTLLTRKYLGMNVAAAITDWAPPSDGNDTAQYISEVCEMTGMSPETIITTELIG